jgi:4-hydroxybenzoate polyprenyltransferase
VGGVAVLAGADAATVLRLGASMTALQVSIGALNDLVDAPADAGRKPGKPIPAGIVSPGTARLVVALGAATGIALAVPSGPAVVMLALVVLGIGWSYDLRAKGTVWSWLPFAIGIPVLPVYGWLGATGAIPGWLAVLVPLGMLVGAGLAVANARADQERDAAAGTDSVALALGDGGSWWADVILLGAALGLAVAWLAATGQGSQAVYVGIAAGAVGLVAGLALGRSRAADQRERGWQLQALGVAVVALAWVAAVAGATA